MKEEYIIVNVNNTIFNKRFIGMKCAIIPEMDSTKYIGPLEGRNTYYVESEDQYLNLLEHNVRKLTKLEKALK